MKKYLLTILVVATVLVACKKEQAGDSRPNSQAHFDDPIPVELPHNDSVTNPFGADSLFEKINPIFSSCVSRNSDGILSFSSSACFSLMMGQIVNSDVSIINSWESGLSFVSRRSYYNALQAADDDYDDDAMSGNRLPDHYFESVLDSEDRVIVGDTLYTFDFGAGMVVCTKLSDMSSWNIYGTYQFKRAQYCQNHRKKAGDKQYGNNEFMNAEKFVGWYLLYSSIGIRQDYYKRNWKGKAKKHSVPVLELFIDHWYQLRYWESGSTLIYTETNKRRKVKTESDQVWTFAWRSGLSGHQGWCSDEFERFHVYKDDFNNDMHHETW